MSTLKLKITEDKATKVATIRVFLTNDILDSIVESLRHIFEIEMYSATEIRSDETSVLYFECSDAEKIQILRQLLTQAYFKKATGPPSPN
jgi:hypothetical protein